MKNVIFEFNEDVELIKKIKYYVNLDNLFKTLNYLCDICEKKIKVLIDRFTFFLIEELILKII